MEKCTFDRIQEDSASAFESLTKIMERNYPPIDWIVDGLIPEEAIIIMSAKPASLKTWLAFDIAIKVASGQPFLDCFKTKKTGVLIIDGESGVRLTKTRFTTLGYAGGTPIYYRSYSGGAKMDESKITEIQDFCIENEIGLVIIDSFARFSGLKDENSATEVAQVFKRFSILKDIGLSVLFISHARKGGFNHSTDGMDSVRGSSDIVAACDIHIGIVRKQRSNTILISQFKNRLDEETPPFKATFAKDSLERSHWEYAGEEAPAGLDDKQDKEEIIDLLESSPNLNQKQIRKALTDQGNNIAEKRLRSLLRELVGSKRLVCGKGERTELLYSVRRNGEQQNG